MTSTTWLICDNSSSEDTDHLRVELDMDIGASTSDNASGPNRKKKRGRPFGRITSCEDEEDVREQVTKQSDSKPLLDINSICKVLCCENMCLAGIGLREASLARDNFQEMRAQEQKQWILDYLVSHSSINEAVKYSYSFLIGTSVILIGTSVMCPNAWRLVIGLKRTRFYDAKKAIEEGKIAVSLDGKHHSNSLMKKTHETIEWIRSYCTQCADKLPDTEKLHLPSCLSARDIYNMCKSDLEKHGEETASESHFYLIWRTHFSHVVIPRMNRFAKCNVCVKIRNELQKTKKQRRAKIVQIRTEHLQIQNSERQKYYKHIRKAKAEPQRYLSIIIDGMDQSKTILPHFYDISKASASMSGLKIHVTGGAIVHGQGAYGFFDMGEFRHDSNMTINVLVNILCMFPSLPPILYLQLNNCGRENKNRFIFSFCALLVKLGIFKKIKVSFLVVGHTHEDIDQMFSRFSTWLNKNDASDMDDLTSGFQASYSHSQVPPTAVKVDHILNVSDWMDKYMSKISLTRRPHVFRFKKDAVGQVDIKCKLWSTDDSWESFSGTEEYLLPTLPPGEPNLARPSTEKIKIEALKCALDIPFIKSSLSSQVRNWWSTCISYLENIDQGQITLEEGKWKLSSLVNASKNSEDALSSSACQQASYTDESEDDIPLQELVKLHLSTKQPLEPVVLGKKLQKKKTFMPDQNRAIAPGDMCLLDIPRWANYWPQVAQVVSVDGEMVNIRWFKGGKTGRQVPEVLVKEGAGRIDWEDTVHINVVWLHGFQLTNGCRLPKEVLDKLEEYDQDY